MMWNFYNILALIPAIFCALEHASTKRAHPVAKKVAAEFRVSSPNTIQYAQTESMTEFGCVLRLPRKAQSAQLRIRQPVQITLHTNTPRFPELKLNSRISFLQLIDNDVLIGIEFVDVSPIMTRSLIEVIYCDETMWATLPEPEDNFLVSFCNLITTPWRVFVRTRHWLYQDKVVQLASNLKSTKVTQHTTSNVVGKES